MTVLPPQCGTMDVAYVTTYDAADPGIWAGTGYHIAKALEKQSIAVQYVGPLRERNRLYLKAMQVMYGKLLGRALHRDREPAVLEGYARQVERALEGSRAQIVFSPGTPAIARLRTDCPIVVWIDATYGAMVNFYVWEDPPCQRSLRYGNAMEREALGRCALAIFSSDWAARSAVELYGVPESRVRVVPFGANIVEDRTEAVVKRMIESRPSRPCRLLFIGIGWERKGGDVAIETTRLLNQRGVPTELTILGSNPPGPLPPFVRAMGFIDKKTQAGRRKFDELFGSSHFLILPARAEAFGVV
ncbi:MAG: glycosyltransferase, partial [Tepidisphaeraceae bacterium]